MLASPNDPSNLSEEVLLYRTSRLLSRSEKFLFNALQ